MTHTLDDLRNLGLAEIDPEIARLCDAELARQRDQLELIASENFTWPAVLQAVGSVLTNKYAEGLPGKRYYGGCEVVDEVEELAIERAKQLFGAEHANVQPHSGASANMAAYYAVLDPGDSVLGLRLDHGGHLTHGLKVNFSGRYYQFHGYSVRREDGRIDLDEVRALALEHRPKLIVAGGSAYPREIDARAFRAIADEAGALLMVDMAHFSGLVAAGLHQNPVESADIVCSTTHKTLAGPRAGFILCRQELAQKIDRAVFPGLQGGPLCHVTAAKAVCFAIAMTEPYRDYQRAVKANAASLADGHHRAGRRAADRRHRHAPRAARPAPERALRQGHGGAAARRPHDRQPQHGARSTSARRRSPRACASARRRRRCAGSTRPTRARSAA